MLFHLHPQFCCSFIDLNPISTSQGMETSDFFWVILEDMIWGSSSRIGDGEFQNPDVSIEYVPHTKIYLISCYVADVAGLSREPPFLGAQTPKQRSRWSSLQSPSSSCRCFDALKRLGKGQTFQAGETPNF